VQTFADRHVELFTIATKLTPANSVAGSMSEVTMRTGLVKISERGYCRWCLADRLARHSLNCGSDLVAKAGNDIRRWRWEERSEHASAAAYATFVKRRRRVTPKGLRVWAIRRLTHFATTMNGRRSGLSPTTGLMIKTAEAVIDHGTCARGAQRGERDGHRRQDGHSRGRVLWVIHLTSFA